LTSFVTAAQAGASLALDPQPSGCVVRVFVVRIVPLPLEIKRDE
jgi:hypothetical protein